MTCFRSGIGLFALLLLASPAPTAEVKTDRYRGADDLAGRIDRLIDAERARAVSIGSASRNSSLGSMPSAWIPGDAAAIADISRR